MTKTSPIDYLLKHCQIVLSVYHQHDKKPGKSWESLLTQLPDVSQVMSASTFKQYISVFGMILAELDKVRQKREVIAQELAIQKAETRSLEKQLQNRQKELDKVRQMSIEKVLKQMSPVLDQRSVRQKLDNPPKRVAGWNLRRSKDGYYRCYRKIKAKLHSIYLGKTFDSKKAHQLIMAKEKRIKLDKS